MKTVYKHHVDIPYSLHDAIVNQIKISDDHIYLGFEKGFVERKEPYKRVHGRMIIENVDLDFAIIELLNIDGNHGCFQGEKIELKDFLNQYHFKSFEIVDELYGYNQVLYSGYLLCNNSEDFIEMNMSIYYTGNIIYEV